jgi:hypothetical protein
MEKFTNALRLAFGSKSPSRCRRSPLESPRRPRRPRKATEGESEPETSAESPSEPAPDAPSGEAAEPEPIKPPRFQSTGDGGAMRGTAPAAQLRRDDLRHMRPADIDRARREGRLNDLLSAGSDQETRTREQRPPGQSGPGAQLPWRETA